MTVEIKSKIVSQHVKTDATAATPEVPMNEVAETLVDFDPSRISIDGRPEGALPALNDMIVISSGMGKIKLYVSVSFHQVEGILNGEKVTIERPIEMFIPHGQLGVEQQWAVGVMRLLSLNAQDGSIAKALRGLRKITWEHGMVTCGRHANNKPVRHESPIAALAWSIQQLLFHRGFLDEEGNQLSLEQLVANYQNRHSPSTTVILDPNDPDPIATVNELRAKLLNSVGTCSECKSGTLVLRDGCPTCLDCGYSKCG